MLQPRVKFKLPCALTTLMLLGLALSQPVPACAQFDSAELLKERVKSSKPVPTDTLQTDRSGHFTYVLPANWSATKNPFHSHDILVASAQAGKKGTLLLEERPALGRLSAQAKELSEELEKNLENFSLVSNEMATLSSGKKVARLICNGKIGEEEVSQILYIIPAGMGKSLLITATVNKNEQSYGLSTIDQFANKVSFKKKGKGLTTL